MVGFPNPRRPSLVEEYLHLEYMWSDWKHSEQYLMTILTGGGELHLQKRVATRWDAI